MLKVSVLNHAIQFGDHFVLTLQRTLRLPNDNKTYPLPPGLGTFPIYKSMDYKDSLPDDWNLKNSYFIPMYQREALWLSFKGVDWKPNAVMAEIGRVNAVSGEVKSESLHDDPQNYLVSPKQLWLDGINSGHGKIRQFVAMPLGHEKTVEASVTGKELYGGIGIKVYEAKKGVFPDTPPDLLKPRPVRQSFTAGSAMGLAAGGQMKQKIYPDPYGVDVWDPENFGEVTIHIVNSEIFQKICGLKSPSTPVDTAAYTKSGFPWFDLYEENENDLEPPVILTEVKTLEDSESMKEIILEDSQIKKLVNKPSE